MLFKYKINLEVEAEFEAPLLGVDATKEHRKQVDTIAKQALAEMIRFKTTSFVGLDRSFSNDDNLKGTYNGTITLKTIKQ